MSTGEACVVDRLRCERPRGGCGRIRTMGTTAGRGHVPVRPPRIRPPRSAHQVRASPPCICPASLRSPRTRPSHLVITKNVNPVVRRARERPFLTIMTRRRSTGGGELDGGQGARRGGRGARRGAGARGTDEATALIWVPGSHPARRRGRADGGPGSAARKRGQEARLRGPGEGGGLMDLPNRVAGRSVEE